MNDVILTNAAQIEAAALMAIAGGALSRLVELLPVEVTEEVLNEICTTADRRLILESALRIVTGQHAGLEETLAAAAQGAQQPSDDLPALIVPDTNWRACMAEIQDIITRPYRGAAELGYDPMNSISLAIVKHMNVLPSEPENYLSEAA